MWDTVGSDDNVLARETLGEIHREVGVVVDVPAFGGLGHDHCGAFCGGVGVVKDVGLGVGGAGEDLIEFFMPEDAD